MILNISLVNINIIYDISAHMYLYNYWERVQNTPVCHSIYDKTILRDILSLEMDEQVV